MIKKTFNKKQRKTVPVFFPTDRNYVPILHVAVQSLVSNSSKSYNYHIHILGENLTEEDKQSYNCYNSDNVKVIFTDMEKIIEKYKNSMNIKYYYSNAIYFRTFIPDLFPQYKKILYFDSDISFNADVAELYNFRIGLNYVGAVTCETVATSPVFTEYAEKFLGMKLPKYFNSGVLVMNCEALRKINFKERFYDLMSKINLELCPDQDAYNLLCQGKTVFLPAVWNKIPKAGSKETLADVKLVHYNLSLKPWRYDNILYGELFWEHAKNTPVYEKLLEMKRSLPENMIVRDKQRMEALMKLAEEKSKVSESVNRQIQNGKLVLLANKDQNWMKSISEMLSGKIRHYRKKIEESLINAEISENEAALSLNEF